MTRFDQIKAAFPEHWRTIVERMDAVWRTIYLPGPAYACPRFTLSGAFIWERSPEGHAFWANLARAAK